MTNHVRELSARLRRASADRRASGACQLEFDPIVIRQSRAGDEPALERLAALDSRALPEGSFLLAEIDSELVAAAPLDLDTEPLSDPFRPTAALRELLKLQARHIRRSRGGLARRVGATPRALGEAA
jgi:hypothetical protein